MEKEKLECFLLLNSVVRDMEENYPITKPIKSCFNEISLITVKE